MLEKWWNKAAAWFQGSDEAKQNKQDRWASREQKFLAARFSLFVAEYHALSEKELKNYDREKAQIEKMIADLEGKNYKVSRNDVRRFARLIVSVLPYERLPFKFLALKEEEFQLRHRLGLFIAQEGRDDLKHEIPRDAVEALQEEINLLSLRLHETDAFRSWVIDESVRYWLSIFLVTAGLIVSSLLVSNEQSLRCALLLVSFAFLLGSFGGLLSIVDRTYRTPLCELVATALIEKPQKKSLMISLLLGGGTGVVAYLVGMSGVFGENFLAFRCVASGKSGVTSAIDLFTEKQAASTFRLIALCTLAGFAERWIPDLLSKATARLRAESLGALNNMMPSRRGDPKDPPRRNGEADQANKETSTPASSKEP